MNIANLNWDVLDEDLDTLVAIEGGCWQCLINAVMLAQHLAV